MGEFTQSAIRSYAKLFGVTYKMARYSALAHHSYFMLIQYGVEKRQAFCLTQQKT